MIKKDYVKISKKQDFPFYRLEYMECDSGKKGHRIFITSGAHGDEVGGVYVVYKLFERLEKIKLKRGSIYAFPKTNPMGVKLDENLNRHFPGKPDGNLAERISNIVFKKIISKKPDFVLDLHNDWRFSIPYAILDPDSNNSKYKEAHNLADEYAHNTGLLIVKEREPINGSLSLSLLNEGVPSITLELGESDVINYHNVNYGLKSIFNLLAALGMIDKNQQKVYNLPAGAIGDVFEYYDKPLSTKSGTLECLIKPARAVEKGQPIAKIIGDFGDTIDTLFAIRNGIVLGHVGNSSTCLGGYVMAFGAYPE